jgi:hypothetical protein
LKERGTDRQTEGSGVQLHRRGVTRCMSLGVLWRLVLLHR